MATITVPFPVPALYTATRVPAAGDPSPPPWPWPEAAVVGSNPLADDSDSTYIQVVSKIRTEENPPGTVNQTILRDVGYSLLPDSAFAGVDPGRIVSRTVLYRGQVMDYTADRIGGYSMEFIQGSPDNNIVFGTAIGGFGFGSGSIVTGSFPVTQATYLAVAAPGHTNAVGFYPLLIFQNSVVPNGDMVRFRLYELAFRVVTTDPEPPGRPFTRVLPRDDGLGASSAPRVVPEPAGERRVVGGIL